MNARAALIFAALIAHSAGGAGAASDGPRYGGGPMPEPPQQRTPWKPVPGFVPEKWLDAAGKLFDLGFADPRGCEYREIEVVVGEAWFGGGGVKKTRGWVLPKTDAQEQEYAVTWNGLVYPVLKVGPPANLGEDVKVASNSGPAEMQRRWEMGPALPEFAESKEGGRTSSGGTLNATSRFEFRSALLLRLGEAEAARDVPLAQLRIHDAFWEGIGNRSAKPRVLPPAKLDETSDPFRRWAETWLWCLFNRGVCAHMRRDDKLALVSLEQLERLRGPLTEEVARRYGRGEVTGDTWTHFLGWLDPAFTHLLADQRRRAAAPKSPLDLAAIKTLPQGERIAALLANLDEVRVFQYGQPGSLNPATEDATVKALVAEGDAAIEPLLKAWEEGGMRLTRSVGFGRDFHYHRYPQTVGSVAFQALAEILHASTDELRAGPGTDREVTPAIVRYYIAKYQDTTPAMRWFRQMADDEAGSKTWLLAGAEIVRPSNQRYLGNGTTVGSPLRPGERVALAGESLRAMKNPSLSELWAQRVPQVTPKEFSNSSLEVQKACAFVVNFGKWDKGAATSFAHELMTRVASHLSGHASRSNGDRTLYQRYLPKLAILCAHGGDGAALDEYCAWLRGDRELFDPIQWTPGGARYGLILFKPLWLFPGHDAVRATLKKLFSDADSPIRPLMSDWKSSEALPSQLLTTPVARSAEFLAHLFGALVDKAKVGTITVKADGTRHVIDAASESWSQSLPARGAVLDRPVDFRACDVCAASLSQWKGFPAMELAWPESKRDEAVKESLRVLREKPEIFDQKSPAESGDFPRFHDLSDD